MIRVVMADDHAIVRAGLRALFAAEADITFVAEADSARAAVAAAITHRPDVLLLDLSMPGENGLEVIAEVRERAPGTRVIVLSMHAAADFVRPALRAGASGYVVKGAGLDSLVQAVRAVAAGQPFLCPQSSRSAGGNLDSLQDAAAIDDPWERLTPREREVLRLVAEGHSNREIGVILGVSPKTADSHRSNLMQKLEIHDAPSLTRYAIRRGLVSE